jgi:hypothetical protein
VQSACMMSDVMTAVFVGQVKFVVGLRYFAPRFIGKYY